VGGELHSHAGFLGDSAALEKNQKFFRVNTLNTQLMISYTNILSRF